MLPSNRRENHSTGPAPASRIDDPDSVNRLVVVPGSHDKELGANVPRRALLTLFSPLVAWEDVVRAASRPNNALEGEQGKPLGV